MATPTQTLLQEVFILATGTAANAEQLASLTALLGPEGNDYSRLVELVDRHMDSLVPTYGVVGLVKAVALNGLGLVFSDEEATAITTELMASGIDTWGKLFAFCVGLENSAGTVLNNRAAAAQGFIETLDATNKAELFTGSRVSGAVQTQLQNIGDSTVSLNNGKQGLAALAANLSAAGIQGAVVDGYVSEATVFADTNANGQLDAGEFHTSTDANGRFVLPNDIGAGRIIAFGGTDIMTGRAFQGVLSAPVGATVVNPLTSVVQTLLATGQAGSVAAATSTVHTALSVPGNVNLLSYDPLAVLASSSASSAAKVEALAVQTTAQQVANVISQTSAAISAGDSARTLAAANTVTSALAGTLAGAGGRVDLGRADTLAGIVQTSATQAGASNVAAQASLVAQVTAASNSAAAATTSLADLARTAVVAQGDATTALASGNFSSVVSASTGFTGQKLQERIFGARTGDLVDGVPVVPPAPAPAPARDTTAPTVASVAITSATRAQNDTLNADDVLGITVTMSEATTVTGTPQLALKIGDTTVQASYARGSGTKALLFTYLIQGGQNDADGIRIDANSLSLNGGTLKDAAGNDAVLAHDAVADNASYLVDTTAPIVTLSPAAAASSMLQLEAIGRINGSDEAPQITAVGSSGEFVVTWSGIDSTGDSSIFVQKFNAAGSTTGILVQLEAIDKADGTDQTPQITALGDSGEFVVTWSGIDSAGDSSIFVQKFDAEGSPTGTPVQLEAIGYTTGTDQTPQITAVGSSGAFVVTWSGIDSAGDLSIFVQKFDAEGGTTDTPVQLEAIGYTTGTDQAPQITAVGSSGAFVVTWSGRDSAGDFSIFVQKFDAEGSPTGTPVRLEAIGKTNGNDLSPQITAVGSSGEFVVTWSGIDSAGDFSIFVQKFDAEGSTTGTPVQLEAIGYTTGTDQTPQITAVGSSGAFVVTWSGQDSSTPTTDYSVFVQKFDANGSTTGTPVQLEAIGYTTGTDQAPQITAVGSSGAFVVTWSGQDSSTPTTDYSIFVQKFDAEGSTTGTPVQLEAIGYTTGTDQTPQITAVGSSGAFVVTWSGQDSSTPTTDYSIFVQKFSASGQPVVLINNDGMAKVRSTEAGTAYLVKSTVTVTTLTDITGAADALWNEVAITTPNTDTALAATDLEEGSYQLYTVDGAGNLSIALAGAVGIDSTAPIASAFTATATTVGATSNEAGTLGLYNGATLLRKTSSGTLSAPMTAGNAAPLTVEAQASLTSTTLRVSDTAGNFATATQSVVLGTTDDDNALNGTDDADFIYGFAGNDTLNGGYGADVLTGDAGVDVLDGGAGNDVFNYTASAELVFNGAFVDSITGGADTDEIKITAAAAVIIANSVSWAPVATVEKITAGTSAGAISISVGDDVTAAGITTIDLSGDTNASGANVIDLSADTTGSLITTVTGSAGVDTITGNSVVQTMTGGAGNDVFNYTAQAELVANGAFVDSITGGADTDEVRITAAADFIIGNADSWARVATVEKITAGTSAGAISISVGDDVTAAGVTTIDLSGDTNATGANVIDLSADTTGSLITTVKGSAGADTITGNSVAQTITGGAGADNLTGGAGADTFVLVEAGLASNAAVTAVFGDTIADFQDGNAVATQDVLQISAASLANLTGFVANAAGVTGAAGAQGANFLVAGAGAQVAAQAYAQFLFNTTTGVLSIDADGTGAGAAVVIGTVGVGATLTAADFLFVA